MPGGQGLGCSICGNGQKKPMGPEQRINTDGARKAHMLLVSPTTAENRRGQLCTERGGSYCRADRKTQRGMASGPCSVLMRSSFQAGLSQGLQKDTKTKLYMVAGQSVLRRHKSYPWGTVLGLLHWLRGKRSPQNTAAVLRYLASSNCRQDLTAKTHVGRLRFKAAYMVWAR